MTATQFTSENVFTNTEAQEFVYQLEIRGPEAIIQSLDLSGRMSIAKVRRLLAARS